MDGQCHLLCLETPLCGRGEQQEMHLFSTSIVTKEDFPSGVSNSPCHTIFKKTQTYLEEKSFFFF